MSSLMLVSVVNYMMTSILFYYYALIMWLLPCYSIMFTYNDVYIWLDVWYKHFFSLYVEGKVVTHSEDVLKKLAVL